VSGLGELRRALSDGLRTGAGEIIASYQRQLLLRDTSTGFDRAYAKANEIPGWFDAVSAASFWAVIHEVRPRKVVEIGSYLGRSTVFAAEALRSVGVPHAELDAIDPHSGDRQSLEKLGLSEVPTLQLFRVFLAASGNAEAVRMHVARSSDVLVEWSDPIDLLFVDGWHAYAAVLSDIRGFGAFLTDCGIICVDDVDNYEEVDRASKVAIAKLGLSHYGVIGGKAWAGRSATPPTSLRGALAVERRVRRLRRSPRVPGSGGPEKSVTATSQRGHVSEMTG